MKLTPKIVRLSAGIPIVEMAKYLGISRWTYSAREKDPDSFTVREAKAFAEKFQTSVDGIFFGNEST